jgi:hypothetical protein
MAHTVGVSGGEIVLTNGSCTLYHQTESGGYDREFIPACFWMDSRGASVTTGGIVSEAGVIVYIPEAHAPKLIAQKDIIVRGNCPHVFSGSTPAAISQSFEALRKAYELATVTAVDDKRYGSALRHIKVTAK